MIENVTPGNSFEVHETGWGEFEINIKLYYVPESLEKPQTLYHHLRLHPYGNTDAEKEVMKAAAQIDAWAYEEQIFNEPYDQFYEILTNPTPRGGGKGASGLGKGTKKMGGGMVGSTGERTALIPLASRPGQPFSRETEKAEIKRLREAQEKVDVLARELAVELKEKEQELARLRQG